MTSTTGSTGSSKAVWISKGIETPVSELNTFRLANCIKMVRGELSESAITTDDKAKKETLLTDLESEYATRTDKSDETA